MTEPIAELIGRTITRAGRVELIIDARNLDDGLWLRTKDTSERIWEYRGVHVVGYNTDHVVASDVLGN